MIARPTTNQPHHSNIRRLGLALAALWLPCASVSVRGALDHVEFFEKRVRPVLVEHCYRCHSAQAEKLKGGLLLDSREALMKGGESGPAVVPEHPDQSRLVTAIGYEDPNLQMPPKAKLPPTQIADLTEWVRRGAPWPAARMPQGAASTAAFDLEERRSRHWAWKPIVAPGIPSVTDTSWPRTPVDRFLLASLETERLTPAPRADWRVLLRRLHFDLTGLPPAPDEVDAFLQNPSWAAYEREVDRLLASPQFGERWARHWLDLVRYAETLGHEFDYANANAWRYRDYVIRALNDDVPYDQFVTEQIAGDLLQQPRRDPVSDLNQSIIGTAFYWLGQRDHSPVDVRQHQAELIDNQIDVLTKTFLGLTVACARCHDHKFDAIPTRDYYALYGILSSSRYAQASLDPPGPTQSIRDQLLACKDTLRARLADTWAAQAPEAARYLLAAQEATSLAGPASDAACDDLARDLDLDLAQLRRWTTALAQADPGDPDHPAGPWVRWARSAALGAAAQAEVWRCLNQPAASPASDLPAGNVFADFEAGVPDGWSMQELAFGPGPAQAGEFAVGTPEQPVARLLTSPAMDSGMVSSRLQGALRSPTFTITNRFVHILAAGRQARINVPVENFTMIRDPIYGGLKRVLNHDDFRWISIDLSMWLGRRCYLEFSDVAAPDPADDARPKGFNPAGYISLRQVVLSDGAPPRTSSVRTGVPWLGATPPASLEDLANRYAAAISDSIDSWRKGEPPGVYAGLLEWLVRGGLLDASAAPDVRQQVTEYNHIEAQIPNPNRVPSFVEGTGLDEPVFIRGNHRLAGALAPRQFLTAIAGENQPPIKSGSGRLELARHLVNRTNPFTSRVMVNRVWLHLFGRGLVPTPDDFGELGQRPRHPALLDWLADWYRTDARWSTKQLVRLLVTSSAYAMSSKPADALAETRDPENLLWHRMPVRRLEGEAIRDCMLAVSGGLNPAMFGPPIPTHLTEFMDGRGRPQTNGPVDGAGRRTIYLEVRRNFVSPFLRTFDLPVPFTTVGQRTVSSVPAQSLILMNDPFVVGEAKRWADRLLASVGSAPEARVRTLFRSALCRLPTAEEETAALQFVEDQRAQYLKLGAEASTARVWADLCHVMFNLKEFVFIN